MKNPTKIGLVIVLFSILGTGSLIKTINANQFPKMVAAIAQDNTLYQVAEAPRGDGDGETNDDAKEKQESVHLQSIVD